MSSFCVWSHFVFDMFMLLLNSNTSKYNCAIYIENKQRCLLDKKICLLVSRDKYLETK